MKPVNYLAFLVTCIVTFTSCSKSSRDPDNNLRVTEYLNDNVRFRFEYNSAGQPQAVRSGSLWQDWPSTTFVDGKTEYQYIDRRIAAFNFTAKIESGPQLKSETILKWSGNKLMQSIINNRDFVSWRTDNSGRITGFTSQKYNSTPNPTITSSDWQYDSNGNVVYPKTENSTIDITYTNKRNPFVYGNTGQLFFIQSEGNSQDHYFLLSANLPEKYVSYRKIVNTYDGQTFVLEDKKLYEYKYQYNSDGTIIGYELHTKLEGYRNGETVYLSESTNNLPLKCTKL
ncbi:hypothetical protein HHL16_01290 [Pseudoflavitalea sp. G-6-1-2]|uniref:hypothetical protein n=1 Tax=Pseudoflavitalea sp. G-6-1-2 TaxID=2728841 RepID=UPI00146BF3B1|nr:hypothetical protein [Pseudoflavitalea sp. G-6-1-2]NML19482.1 hypothetical protein [Pseudoflavitalea sp. G-6-1-2]